MIGPSYDLFRDPRIARRVCELLDAMEGTDTLELFPGHLSQECQDFLCRTLPFSPHQKAQIDSSVSWIKTSFRRWHGVHTTERKVRIRPEPFITNSRSISDDDLRAFRRWGYPWSGVINEDWCHHPDHEQSGRVDRFLNSFSRRDSPAPFRSRRQREGNHPMR